MTRWSQSDEEEPQLPPEPLEAVHCIDQFKSEMHLFRRNFHGILKGHELYNRGYNYYDSLSKTQLVDSAIHDHYSSRNGILKLIRSTILQEKYHLGMHRHHFGRHGIEIYKLSYLDVAVIWQINSVTGQREPVDATVQTEILNDSIYRDFISFQLRVKRNLDSTILCYKLCKEHCKQFKKFPDTGLNPHGIVPSIHY